MILQQTHAMARKDALLLVAILDALAQEQRSEQVDELTRKGVNVAEKMATYLESFRQMHKLHWRRPPDGLPL